MLRGLKNTVRWKRHLLKREQLALTHPLDYFFLEITRRCNLSCLYCGSDCGPTSKRQELSARRWIEIMTEIAGDFDPAKIVVAVTGGEPLLRGNIFEVLHALHDLGFRYGMVTNGTRLNEDTAKRLVHAQISAVSLSLDGPPELNDALRGPGSAKKVETAVEALGQAGFEGTLEVLSTITKPVIAHLTTMRRYLGALKVRHWRMLPMMPIGRAVQHPELMLSPQELKTLLDFVAAGRDDGYNPCPEFAEEGFLGDRYEGVVRPYLCRCSAGLTTGGILADGRIGACPELADTFIQGHVDQDRFAHVWETRYKELRDRSWTEKGACQNCDAYAKCGGGALHLYADTSAEISRCFYKMLSRNECPG